MFACIIIIIIQGIIYENFLNIVLMYVYTISNGYTQTPHYTSNSTLNIASSKYDLKVRINGIPRNWRVSPNVSPDTLTVECKSDQFTNVALTEFSMAMNSMIKSLSLFIPSPF